MLEYKIRNWYRDNFLVSTDRSLIQIDAVNEAMGSDLMWWAQGLPRDEARRAINNAMCFGLYELPESSSAIAGTLPSRSQSLIRESNATIAGKADLKQIGLVRLLTDDVTFAYITDVYVLREYQGQSLGRWMLACLDEVIKSWPHLRRVMFLTSDEMIPLYRKMIGAKAVGEPGVDDLLVGIVEGKAALHR
jgi:ribosomal protein S18 acetylase RimI-like enzyme